MKRQDRTGNLIISAVAVVVLLVTVFFMQYTMTLNRQHTNSKVQLSLAKNRIAAMDREQTKDWESYDSFMQSKADMITYWLILVFALSMYTCILTSITENSYKLNDKLESVEAILLQNQQKTEDITENYKQEYLERAQRIAYMISQCPQLVNDDSLTQLPKVKDKLSSIVEGPFYKGVSGLGDSSVVIRIVASCMEKDRIQLIRDLNREIKLIFDENDVGIPFPQIVINKPEQKVVATAWQKHESEAFVAQQKILSEKIVSENENQ